MLVDEKSRRVRDATKFIYATIAYSLRRNEWTKASRFPRRIAFASSCTTANGVCYVVGGQYCFTLRGHMQYFWFVRVLIFCCCDQSVRVPRGILMNFRELLKVISC